MKISRKKIQEKINEVELEWWNKEEEQKNQSQIKYFDTPGRKLDNDIKNLRGFVQGLRWVLINGKTKKINDIKT